MTDEQKQPENEIDTTATVTSNVNDEAIQSQPVIASPQDETISSIEQIASVNEELPSAFAEATADTRNDGENDKKDERLVNFDELKPGQTVRLHERIIDISSKGEERERIQIFEGIILGLHGSGISRTLTIRKISGGIGVEKIYPVSSPVIAKIELVKTARVRRAKLSFLNNLKQRFKRKLKETYAE